MSLATRCTSCGTAFRVAHDQLEVSEGWVRCGKCGEVFSALERLFDLERDGRLPRPAPAPTPEASVADRGLEIASKSTDPTDPATAVAPPSAGPASALAATSDAVPERDRHEFADARFDSELEPDSAPARRAESDPEPADLAEPGAEFVESMLADESAAPAFVRHADRRARWHSPRMRAALGATALALVVLAAGQALHHQRDLIAAHWPQTRAPLFAWCAALDCTLAPLRGIEHITVESTALTRSPAPDAFAFSVTLRNRAAVGLATPWVELTLKEGELPFARRVLSPDDFRTPLAVLPALAESNLQLLLSAGNPRVNGYSVEIFYP